MGNPLRLPLRRAALGRTTCRRRPSWPGRSWSRDTGVRCVRVHGGLGAEARLGGMSGVRVADGRFGARRAPGGDAGGAVLRRGVVSSRLRGAHTQQEKKTGSRKGFLRSPGKKVCKLVHFCPLCCPYLPSGAASTVAVCPGVGVEGPCGLRGRLHHTLSDWQVRGAHVGPRQWPLVSGRLRAAVPRHVAGFRPVFPGLVSVIHLNREWRGR